MNLIVAICKKNNGIGFQGGLPWHLKQDLKYFKDVTTHGNQYSNVVIMGRKTWDSLPIKPLPNRINVVITRNQDSTYLEKFSKYDNTFVSNSIQNILSILSSIKCVKHNIFVIGGEDIYKLAIESNLCSQLYITEVYNEFECDTYFPMKDVDNEFNLVSVSKFKEENGISR